jgi:heme iron utilization protein
MTSKDGLLLRSLLVEQRVLALGVIVDGEPYVGLVPFAVQPDVSAILIHTSQLARHSEGLEKGARFSGLIHEPDTPDADARQLPRLTVQGRVTPLEPGTAAWQQAHDVYVQKLPSSEMMFGFGDFTLHALTLERGRLVVGFASTIDLDAGEFRSLAPLTP